MCLCFNRIFDIHYGRAHKQKTWLPLKSEQSEHARIFPSLPDFNDGNGRCDEIGI